MSISVIEENELPTGWTKILLENVCSKITDGTHHSPPEEAQSREGEYLYITAKNIKEWGIDLENVTFIPKSIHQSIFSRCNPEKEDVLYIKDQNWNSDSQSTRYRV